MKKIILLLGVLCILLSSVSLFAQRSSTLTTTQNIAARDKDKDSDHNKGKPRKKRRETVLPRAHNKH